MCNKFSKEHWVEVTRREIEIAMLMPGEYVEEDGKYYIRPGSLDGYICPCIRWPEEK